MRLFLLNESSGKRFLQELHQFFTERVTIHSYDIYEFCLTYNVEQELSMFDFEKLIILCRRYDVSFYMSANDYDTVTFSFRRL